MDYTRGKWERYNAPNGEHLWCGDKHIADFDGENANADAKLCVVAPLLYEALGCVLRSYALWGKVTQPDIAFARKAQAKAESRNE